MSAKDRKAAMSAEIRNAILTLALEPGSDLDEQAYCEAFDLSRTPVREVFRELDGQGYVELRENRGTRVSDLSPAKLRDFFLSAPMIYAAILRLAARNADPSQIVELERSQAAFKESLRIGSVADRALANIRFHEITGEMAGNAYLLPSFQRLLIDHARIGMTFYQPQSAEMTGNLEAASRQHDAIIEAIRNRDEARAADLADQHWALSRDQFEMFVMPGGLDGRLGEIRQPTMA